MVVVLCVGIVFIVFFVWVVDCFGVKVWLLFFGVVYIIVFVGYIVFVVYDKLLFGYKWYVVVVFNVENVMVLVMYLWVNLICIDDVEECVFVLSFMFVFVMVCNIWVFIFVMLMVEGL